MGWLYSKNSSGYTCSDCGQFYSDVAGAIDRMHEHYTERHSGDFSKVTEPITTEEFSALKNAEPWHKTGIDATLAERGSRYGAFTEHARIAQSIKRAMADSPNWEKLADDQREALEMVAHKVGRILNGDPDFHDSWHDVVGYVKLVADRLQQP